MDHEDIQYARNRPRDLIRLMRPGEWVKNLFVLSGLLFGHQWNEPLLIGKVLLCTAAFCLVSSGAYILNDYRDIEQDRLHKEKKNRPLASGTVSLPVAAFLMLTLWISAFSLAAFVSPEAVGILATYLSINILYSYKLKSIVLVDVFTISFCFLLRILMGTVAVGITPSNWLLLCGMMLTLFLGFSKRRAEMGKNGETEVKTRAVCQKYSISMLDQIMTLCAACSIMTFALYTMDPAVIKVHGTPHLILTVPFVTFGILRYITLVHRRNVGEEISSELVRDLPLVLAVVAWAGTVIWLIAG